MSPALLRAVGDFWIRRDVAVLSVRVDSCEIAGLFTEGGFALWPSKYTIYSIANSPYKNGKGDIVLEFVTACREHGIKPGLYIAASCDGEHLQFAMSLGIFSKTHSILRLFAAYHHCGPEQPLPTAAEYEQLQNDMVREHGLAYQLVTAFRCVSTALVVPKGGAPLADRWRS